MSDLLRRLFTARPPREEETLPTEFAAAEAGLRFRREDAVLAVYTTAGAQPLFEVTGAAPARLRTVRTERGGHPAIVMHLAEDLVLTCVQFGAVRPGTAQDLVRATRKRLPEGGQALELTFASGEDQVRYLAELGPGLRVQGFREVSQAEAVFTAVPPVSQMVAFLKATLHQRRTALRSLQGLARRCGDARVRALVDSMGSRMSQGHDFTQPLLVELRESLEAQGRPVYPNTLTALCLLADLYLGRIDEASVQRVATEDRPLAISPEAAAAAARFLGGEAVRPTGPEAARALEFLKIAVAERSARTILEDLAEDSGSATSRARVRRLLERVAPGQSLGNDEQEALRSYLAACGRSIHPDTISAVCLYVDFEAGILTEEDIDAITPTRAFLDHSLYALQSVAGAFEAELRCFRVPQDEESRLWRGLKYLALLGHKGLLARFVEPGKPGFNTRHLLDPAAVDAARAEGLRFNGEVLVQIPALEYLDVADLREILRKGVAVLACFQSEDRLVRWRVADPAAPADPVLESLTGPGGFVEGFRAYRFHGKVIGRLAEATPEQLVGQRSVLAVHLDDRGNRNLHFVPVVTSPEDLLRPPRQGLEWSGRVAVFPNLQGFPTDLAEPGQDYLLGRPEEASPEALRLGLCFQAVQTCLVHPPEPLSLAAHPEALDRLRRVLRSPQLRSALLGVVDPGTRHVLTAMLGREGQPLRGDLLLHPALLAALEEPEGVEVAGLLVLHALCGSQRLRMGDRTRDWRRTPFLDLLQDRLFALAEAEEPAARAAACGLLGTAALAGSRSRREAAAYLLARHLEDGPAGPAAAVALAALALAPAVPAPAAVDLGEQGLPPPARGAEVAEVEELAADLRTWLSLPGTPAEIPARANLRGEERKIVALATLMARLNEAARRDGSTGWDRRLVVLPCEHEQPLRKALFQAWQAFAAARGFLLEQVKGREAYDDFLNWLSGAETGLPLPPRLKEAPVETLAARGILSVGSAPLFLRLAALVPATGDPAGPTLLRLPPGLSFEGMLDPGRCDVFHRGAGHWQPFLHTSYGPTLGLGWTERTGYDAMGAVYAAVAPAPPAPARLEEEREPPEPGAGTLADLAEDLARTFLVPGERRQAALNILLGLAPASRYPLPTSVGRG